MSNNVVSVVESDLNPEKCLIRIRLSNSSRSGPTVNNYSSTIPMIFKNLLMVFF
jgi:hypothetical protein